MYGFVFLHLLDYCEQIALLHERHDISIRKSLFKIFTSNIIYNIDGCGIFLH